MSSTQVPPDAIPNAQLPPSAASRTSLALNQWRTKLLELSKRNRALNFKPTKVSTVAIVDEQPVEVFRHLVVEGRPMKFRPTLPSAQTKVGEAPEPRAGTVSGVPGVDDSEEIQSLEIDFVPYNPDTLDDRHTDDVLQAQATPESLDKSLRRLDEQARGHLEEQGVNVLFLALGMLHYSESQDSKEVFRAPILMVPVRLNRRSARSGFTVEATDDEAILNPALAEWLRRSFGSSIPELPQIEEPSQLSLLQDFYSRIADIAAERTRAGMPGWAVKTDIFLGLFSFQKLVMFKDLERNGESFSGHRLTRLLVSREARGESFRIGLPQEVAESDLDEEFAPEQTAQVVDADSSQLRAIFAAARGHDLVLEGPPGTGKSQTITNLIAQALYEGKSVLFVAEKMAALSVVHQRLMRAGLGEFCLEVHASKANKRLVMQDLRTALDASLQRPSVERQTGRLPTIRRELTNYVRALHTPFGALGLTPYRVFGLLEKVLDVPRVRMNKRPANVKLAELEETEALLSELAAAQGPVGAPAAHPWRDAARPFYTPASLEDVVDSIRTALTKLDATVQLARSVEREYSLRSIKTLADVASAATMADIFARSPGAPIDVLKSTAWNSPPKEAREIVSAVSDLHKVRKELVGQFTPDALDQDHAADIAYIENKLSGAFGFLAFIDARYRTIKRRWLAYRQSGYQKPMLDQANDLKRVDRYRANQQALASNSGLGRSLFGDIWRGEQSDPIELNKYIEWVVDLRGICVKQGLEEQTLKVATGKAPEVGRIRELAAAARELETAIKSIGTAVQWPENYLVDAEFSAVHSRLDRMAAEPGQAHIWAAYEQVRSKAAATPAGELVEQAARHHDSQQDLPYPKLSRIFRRAVLECWLDEAINARPELQQFATLRHEQRLSEFRKLDEAVLRENQAALVAKLRMNAQQRLQMSDARAGLPFLQREMAKQRNIAPLRTILKQSEAAVRAIKPCFLMSPLTVAQYLAGETPSFDLVIFDEASQLPSEDAIGAICRGRQLIVVGDPKQLPPTNFFASSTGGSASPIGEDGLPIVEDTESILEEFMGAGVPTTRLKWHYRSAHESLITFSNVSFYDADLYTFPSVETNSTTSGLSFEYVADGVYEGKGLNMAEARRVVDAVVRHAKERPHESLGVGTFNLRQQLAILDELELRRRQDPDLEGFFNRSNHEPFFVKNLENIQGDERDVIFLSVTYARAADGVLRYNFGPINGENGWRRLNVLTTRARKRMRVFSSIRGEDINAAATTSRGAHLMREFLLYAEHGRLQSRVASVTSEAGSPFESEVAAELVRRGIRVVPQVGVAGYRIDLGIQDDSVPGRFVCGIECDGVAYHSSETARDRDRLRQQILEARGWTIIRLWSTDWFKDRAGEINRILSLIDKARRESEIRVKAEAEMDARQRELAEAEAKAAEARREQEENQRLAAVAQALEAGPYRRPTLPAYRFADIPSKRGTDILDTPTSHVTTAIIDVVRAESPVHLDQLQTRIASAWGATRVGNRIADKIEEALESALRSRKVERRGDFFWTSGTVEARPRSRAGTKMTGLHVAPEEVFSAVRLVLEAAGGMTRDELLSEVRQILGVGKPSIQQHFVTAIDNGVRAGLLGEGSTGLALRH